MLMLQSIMDPNWEPWLIVVLMVALLVKTVASLPVHQIAL
jgi:hypothetical protein